MLNECSNPSCAAPFRHLKDGRLFCLESDRTLRSSKVIRVEYFWLCHRCSNEMILRLREDGTVVAVLLPEPIRGAPDSVSLTCADRKMGLLLHSVSSLLPEHLEGGTRTRLKNRYYAA